MKYLIILLALAGCSEVPVNPNMEAMVRADAANRINAFNELRHISLPVPKIVFSVGNEDGEEDYGTITINPVRCAADIEDCLDDTVPHELAHEAADFLVPLRHYQTFSGGKVITHIESEDGSHGPAWCDAMRAFGGVPEKHGYCH